MYIPDAAPRYGSLLGNSCSSGCPICASPSSPFFSIPRIMYFVAQGKPIIPTLTYYIGMSFNAVCLWLCWRYPRRKQEPEVSGAAWGVEYSTTC